MEEGPDYLSSALQSLCTPPLELIEMKSSFSHLKKGLHLIDGDYDIKRESTLDRKRCMDEKKYIQTSHILMTISPQKPLLIITNLFLLYWFWEGAEIFNNFMYPNLSRP